MKPAYTSTAFAPTQHLADATAKQIRGESPPTSRPVPAPKPVGKNTPSALKNAPPDELAQLLAALADSAKQHAESNTAASSREAAMLAFAKMQKPSPPRQESRRTQRDDEDALTLSTFLAGEPEEFTPELCDRLAKYLDTFRQDYVTSSVAATAAAPATAAAAAAAANTANTVDNSLPVHPKTEKESRFLSTLIEVTQCLRDAAVPYFITCGTALGALREKRFIPHDDDVDIGVLFDEVVAASTSGDDEPRDRVQSAVMDLLSIAGQRARLHCFDVLGEIERGFQLRFRDTVTGVLVDVNLYYTDTDDGATGAKFVWSATHYGKSSDRKHGMYRYRNSYPLELREVHFYSLRVRAPTERYLEEYFGKDWRVPKVFNYDDGLAGEYKNIIPE